jgi:hypothetical protein
VYQAGRPLNRWDAERFAQAGEAEAFAGAFAQYYAVKPEADHAWPHLLAFIAKWSKEPL